MHPTLLDVFDMHFHAYATMLALAFLVGTLAAVRSLNRREPPIPVTTLCGVWAFVGALLGAKAFWIAQYDSISNLWRVVFFWESGLVFYGGLIGAIVGLVGYLKFNKLPVLVVADACAPFVALGEAITRVGCFLNGCCWGRVSDVPWALAFPRSSPVFEQHAHEHLVSPTAMASLPVHPTQLYMVLGLMAAFALLLWAGRRARYAGQTTLLYLFLYGIVRFTVEIFRGDCPRSLMNFTLSQMISFGLIVAAGIALAVLAFRQRSVCSESESEAPVKSGMAS